MLRSRFRRRTRRAVLEVLEDRRILAVDWRNPVDAVDVNADSTPTPLDAVIVISDLNTNGPRDLPSQRAADAHYLDPTGDQVVTPLDALSVINHLNRRGLGDRTLREGSGLADESFVTITLGQTAGSREYAVRIDARFDASDSTAALDDLLAVYLVQPNDARQTLLDRGIAGTTLFALSESRAEVAAGLASWDGSVLRLDLTGVAGLDTGRLKFQLLNHDSDTGSTVTLQPLENTVDPAGPAPVPFAGRSAGVTSDTPVDPSGLAVVAGAAVQWENVRWDGLDGRYVADLVVHAPAGMPLGRQTLVAFAGLPAGAVLRHAAGSLPTGEPFLSLADLLPGGLAAGALADPVRVEFDHPGRTPFTVLPRVLSAANQPPTLAPLGPLSVMPGVVLTVPLDAGDANGDLLSFAVVGTNLPPITLDGNGRLTIRPLVEHVGQHTFDVVVSDGSTDVSRTVALTVAADPLATTRVSGRVLRIDGSPLAGMQVEVGAVQGLTTADGSFTLDLGTGPVVGDTIKIRGELFAPGGPVAYPFIAEKLAFILDRPVMAGIDNVIDRPIFLPPLDLANGRPIDPLADTNVTTDAIPGVSVMVRAGTLMNQQGTPFTGTLSITEVPVNLTPAALPPTLFPDLVVTIQPGEMVFAFPAPMTFPNRSGWAPGTLMDLWSINPVSGEFDDVGDMRVSTNGQIIETISGGVRNSSWHLVGPRPTTSVNTKTEPANQDKKCKDCPPATVKEKQGGSSEVELHSGAYLEDHSLVTYSSLGETRGLRIVYDSERADARPIFTSGYDNFPGAQGPFRVVGRLTIQHDGMELVVPGHRGDEFGLRGGEHFWSVPETAADIRVSLQADLRAMPSGRYEYGFETGIRRFNGDEFVGTATISVGDFVHVNTKASPYGAGWGIAGLRELIENADGSILYLDGDGSEVLFEKTASGYESPPGDFSTLVKNGDGTCTQTFPDGLVLQFDADGRLASETDRNGNESRWEYDAAGRLARWIDPVGLVTTLAYSPAGKLQSVTDPGGRVTRFEHDSAGNLTRITDPDNSSRTFRYDGGHHMTGEIDQRGNREHAFYGFAGRVTQLIRKDGGITRIAPAQTAGLLPPSVTSQHGFKVQNGQTEDKPRANAQPLRMSFDRNRTIAHFADPRGRTHFYELDQAGQMGAMQDQVGSQGRVERNAENLITQEFDGRGHRTDFTYDARGNLLTVEDEVARAARRATAAGLFEATNYLLPDPGSGFTEGLAVGMGDFNGDGADDVIAAVGHPNFPLVSLFLSDGHGGLGTRQDISVPTSTPHNDLAVADFDRDGNVDVVVVGSPITVLFGNGDGTFRHVTLADPGGTRQPRVTAADLDADGDLDILAAASASNQAGFITSHVVAYFNQGNGTFGSRQIVAEIFGDPSDPQVGDLTGDGRPDVALLHGVGENRFAVLRRNADGTYTSIKSDRTSGPNAHATIAILDVTGDGRPDLFSTRLYRNNGDETFTDLGFSIGGDEIEIRDLDGDGRQDAVQLFLPGTDDESQISFYRNLGNGSFQLLNRRKLGGSVQNLAVGDVNRDGRLDVAAPHVPFGASSLYGFDLSLLIQRGDFEFAGDRLSQPHQAVAVGDFDEDGIPDLLTAGRGTMTKLHKGIGNGSFGFARELGATESDDYTGASHSIDLDGDGFLDAIFGRTQSIVVLYGESGGGFSPPVNVGSLLRPTQFESLDIDRDGDLDLFVKADNGFATFRHDGHRQFTRVGSTDRTHAGIVHLGDLDADGNVDLLVPFLNSDSSVGLFRGQGDGTFTFVADFGVSRSPSATALADVTGDGRLDLIHEVFLNNGSDARVEVWPGNDTLGFDRAAKFNTADNRGVERLVPADVNLDGHLDLLGLSRQSQRVDVMLNDGTGRFTAGTHIQVTTSESFHRGPIFLNVADLDSDGDPDFVTPSPHAGEVATRLNNTINVGCGDGPCRQEYTYDPAFSQLTSITDELGHQTLLELDARGNATRMTRVVGRFDSPQNGETDDVVTRMTYDARGRVLTETDPRGHVTAWEYDPFSRVTRVTYAQGTADEATESYEYDAAGNVTALIDALGRRTTLVYDGLNRITRITDPLGQETRFAFDAAGNVTSLVDKRGNETRSTYDSLDRMVTTIDPRSGVTTYGYDPLGNITSHTDEIGRTTRFTYDARNRRIETIDPDGGKWTNRFDLDSHLVRVTDPLGHSVAFSYDARGRTTRVVDPIQQVYTYVFDPADRLLQSIDPLNRRTNSQYDDLDRRIRMTDPLGGVTRIEFDKTSNVVATTDEIGRTWRREYDARDRLVAITDPLAGVRRFLLDDVGNLVGEMDELGRTTTTAYDALDRVTTVTDPAGSDTRFTYDPNSNVTTVTDRRGFAMRYEYDALNRQVRRIDALGGVALTEFDPASQILGVTDEIGRETTFQYDGRGNVVRVTDPRGNATTFAYDAKSNQIRRTDALGHVTRIEYDPRDLPLRVTDPLGQVSSVRYDAVGNVIASTDRRGHVTRTEFDGLNRPVKATDALGAFERYEYDAASQLVGVFDRLGRATRFEFDDLGRMTSRTDPLGGVVRSTYDAVGNQLTRSDELNRVTTFTYNVLDRVLTQRDPVGNVTTFAYDAEEHVVAATDPRGNTTRSRYDALDRFDQLTDAVGSTVTYTFDAASRRLTRTDELGRTTRMEYDGNGNVTRVVDPLEHVTTYEYDAIDRLVASADPLEHRLTYVYDGLDRLIRETDPRGAIVEYGYDPNGNRTSLTDPVGNVTTFAYDALNRMTGDTNQLGLARTYAYDAVGNLLSRVDRNGRRIDYTYDDLNRPTAENWFATAAATTSLRTITTAYDAASQTTGVSDPTATYAMTYDRNGDLTSIDNAGTPGVPNVVFTFAFDAARNRTRRSETIGGESGAVNDYTYDALHRLTRITVGQTATLPVNDQRIDLAYDVASQYARIDRYSDVAGTSLVASSQFTFDAASRLTDLLHDRAGTTINDYANVWDAATRLTQVTSSDGVSTFAYDDANQLLAADFSFQPDESFSFDLAGNRTNAGYQTTPNNRLQTDGRSNFEYDHEGNLVRSTDIATGRVTEYTFDHRNRLTSAVQSDSAGAVLMRAEYRYDPFNRRVAKWVDPDGDGPAAENASHFVYDGPHIALEFNAAGDLVRRVLHGDLIDQVFAEDLLATGQTLWSLTDHLGTIRDVVDDTGTVVNHLTYNSFGAITAETHAAVDHLFSFTGREFDAETGNYYYRARYYDPRTGRFMSEDPIGFASGDYNLQRYVGNTPSNFRDPSGNEAPGKNKQNQAEQLKRLYDYYRSRGVNEEQAQQYVSETKRQMDTGYNLPNNMAEHVDDYISLQNNFDKVDNPYSPWAGDTYERALRHQIKMEDQRTQESRELYEWDNDRQREKWEYWEKPINQARLAAEITGITAALAGKLAISRLAAIYLLVDALYRQFDADKCNDPRWWEYLLISLGLPGVDKVTAKLLAKLFASGGKEAAKKGLEEAMDVARRTSDDATKPAAQGSYNLAGGGNEIPDLEIPPHLRNSGDDYVRAGDETTEISVGNGDKTSVIENSQSSKKSAQDERFKEYGDALRERSAATDAEITERLNDPANKSWWNDFRENTKSADDRATQAAGDAIDKKWLDENGKLIEDAAPPQGPSPRQEPTSGSGPEIDDDLFGPGPSSGPEIDGDIFG